VKWERLALPSRRRLFRATSCCDHIAVWSVVFSAGQHRPCNARQLIGHGDHDDVFRSAGIECVQPGSDRRPVPLDPQYCGPGSVDEDLAQVDVAAFADAEQPRPSSSGILSWHDTEPSSKVTTLSKGRAVADGGNDSRGYDRPDPG